MGMQNYKFNLNLNRFDMTAITQLTPNGIKIIHDTEPISQLNENYFVFQIISVKEVISQDKKSHIKFK